MTKLQLPESKMKISNCLAIALIAAVAFASGCDNTAVTDKDARKSAANTHVHADGSVHSNDDHDRHHVEGHTHGAGPHGGTIVDWGGGKYHVELTVDHDKQEATAYILGTDEKTPVPVDAKEIMLTIKDPSFTMTLAAKPMGSELMSGSSRFAGNHESLETAKGYEGSISGVIDETPYSGNFKEEKE